MTEKITKIALFGTSADPPTTGHRAILQWLSHHYDLVAIWAADNPFKSHSTTLEHRAKMLGVLIESVETPGNNLQLYQELSSRRTIETVNKGRQVWGNQPELTLVVGADIIKQMPRWYQIQDLLEQVRLLIIPRPGYPLTEANLQEIRRVGGRCKIANLRAPAVSSTAYREKGDHNVVVPLVKEYINREQLYLCQERHAH